METACMLHMCVNCFEQIHSLPSSPNPQYYVFFPPNFMCSFSVCVSLSSLLIK